MQRYLSPQIRHRDFARFRGVVGLAAPRIGVGRDASREKGLVIQVITCLGRQALRRGEGWASEACDP